LCGQDPFALGMLAVVILSLGYLVMRQVLQLMIMVVRGPVE
jgi:hypothetical protein